MIKGGEEAVVEGMERVVVRRMEWGDVDKTGCPGCGVIPYVAREREGDIGCGCSCCVDGTVVVMHASWHEITLVVFGMMAMVDYYYYGSFTHAA